MSTQTKLPYCTGVWCFLGKGKGGNPKCVEIIKWAVHSTKDQAKKPTLFCDPYYLDTEGRAYLQEIGFPYHCSVNRTRFEYLFETTKVRVKGTGQWEALYSQKNNEFAASIWDVDVGKRFLLSTSLKKSGQSTKNKPESPPGWYAYKHSFDACDKFNLELSKIFWPYKQKGWQNDFDDFLFSTALFNAYVLYRESNKKINIDFITALGDLSQQLYTFSQEFEENPSWLGTLVEAEWTDGEWYPGIIVRDEDGSYDVQFYDGDFAAGLSINELRETQAEPLEDLTEEETEEEIEEEITEDSGDSESSSEPPERDQTGMID